MTEAIAYERDGHLAHVRLQRPQALNALTVEMDVRLQAIWLEIESDPEVRVILLSAAGDRAFCVGADIHDLPARERSPIAFGGGLTGLGGPLLELRKPLVAAVNGYAWGGGCELAMCADVIVASDTASFAIPEAKLGVIGDAGVVHRLIRQLPYRVAMAMILTGEPLDAPAALHHGLVNEVTGGPGLDAAAAAWARKIAAVSPLVAQAAKQAAGQGEGRPLASAVASRYELIERFDSSRDKQEALDAFAARREPHWQGR